MSKPQYIDDTARTVSDRMPERTRERVSERREEKRLERPNRGRLSDDGIFSIDLSLVPKGMTFNWKRVELMGMQDKRNQVMSKQYHWEPVPHKMQPHILGFLGDADPEQPIIVGGQMLCQRPTYLCNEAERENLQQTAWVRDQQLNSLRLQSREQVGDRYTKIRKTVEQVQAVD